MFRIRLLSGTGFITDPDSGSSLGNQRETIMVVRIAVTAVFISTALVSSALSSTQPSSGSCSSRPSIYTTTPGYTNPRDAVVADVLLDRIVFSDGVQVQSSEFVYPGQVLNLTYNGPLARFRV